MKKILLLFLILCLTGCFKNEDFNRTCKTSIKTFHISDNTTIDTTYNNEDKLLNVVYIKTYKALDEEGIKIILDIKESALEYNKKYAGKESIKITVSKDSEKEYELKYYIDVQNTDEDILKEFELRKNSIKFFNKMRSKDFECKRAN